VNGNSGLKEIALRLGIWLIGIALFVGAGITWEPHSAYVKARVFTMVALVLSFLLIGYSKIGRR
jgi:polyferredoxin